MPKQPERKFEVGQHIRVNLHTGRIEEAVIRAIVERTDGLRLQVDFGHEQTPGAGAAVGCGGCDSNQAIDVGFCFLRHFRDKQLNGSR